MQETHGKKLLRDRICLSLAIMDQSLCWRTLLILLITCGTVSMRARHSKSSCSAQALRFTPTDLLRTRLAHSRNFCYLEKSLTRMGASLCSWTFQSIEPRSACWTLAISAKATLNCGRLLTTRTTRAYSVTRLSTTDGKLAATATLARTSATAS